ncbi:MAG: polyphosphate kinase, partial [Pseudomonadota bacterium]
GKAPRLDALDTDARLDAKTYQKKLEKLQHTLMRIQQAYLFSGRTAVVVFEGWDAAGKGGTIRRMSQLLDPRGFKVWPIGAPSGYYLDRHYLTRFVERLPPHGSITVFDRSWYGRVLVERIEELAPTARWRAAYDEINAFEQMLSDDGVRIVKLFLHITPEEQLRRFEKRLLDPLKRWKLTYEDFRNRSKWDAYAKAIDEMFAKTSTRSAPWVAVPANDKKYARIAAIQEIATRLAKGVDLRPPPLDAAVLAEAGVHFSVPEALTAGIPKRNE